MPRRKEASMEETVETKEQTGASKVRMVHPRRQALNIQKEIALGILNP